MDGFFLLLGHLVGDYIVQNDWMAANKAAHSAMPGPLTAEPGINTAAEIADDVHRFLGEVVTWTKGHVACTAHCLLYTLAVWACSFWWMPAWGLGVCLGVHWAVDRFRLARWWMVHVSGQRAFATGPLSPWSIVVVDNTAHLATLAAIAALAGRV